MTSAVSSDSQDAAGEQTRARLRAVRASAVAWTLATLAFVAALPILVGVSGWLLVVSWLLAMGVVGLTLALWRRISTRARSRRWQRDWWRGGLFVWFLLCALVAAPVYVLAIDTEWRPAVVPTVTLTHGPRTLVLQGMQHVGAERFFQAVFFDLEKALADGYVLVYEGVAGSDAEADAWFRQTLTHGKDLGDSYRELGRLCGLSYQIDYFGPLVADASLNPSRHVTMDVDTRALKNEYDRLLVADPAFASAMRAAASAGPADEDDDDFLSRFVESQRQGSESRQLLAGTVCRGVMTYVMRRANEAGHNDTDPLLLTFRNRHLVDALLADGRAKLYVTYGAAHLPGVVHLLTQEAGWQVKSVKWMRTIAAPEQVGGAW